LNAVDRSSGAADSAWMLLQTYLGRHGDHSSRYHRCTAAKLLQHGFTLPTWLTNDYKVNVNMYAKCNTDYCDQNDESLYK